MTTNKNNTAMSAAPSLTGPTRSISVGCDDENFSSPKESRLRASGVGLLREASRPKHHLFENEVLNQLFCRSAKDTRTFCCECVSSFRELFGGDAMQGEEHRIIAHQAAMMETAFELGWREALRREAIPRIKQVRASLLSHCDTLVAQRDGKEPIHARIDMSSAFY